MEFQVSYLDLSTEDLKKELSKLKSEMEEIKALELNLDLSRGKPDKEQLNLSMEMLNTVNSKSILDAESGMDCRNYGGLDGIPDANDIFCYFLGSVG